MDILVSKHTTGSLFTQRHCDGIYNSPCRCHYLWLQILRMLSYCFIHQTSNIRFYSVSTLYNLPRFKHKYCSDYLLAQAMFGYYFNSTTQKFQLSCSLKHINFCDIVSLQYTECLCFLKVHMLKPNLQCESNWRCGLWEVIRLGRQSSLVIKDIPERSFTFLIYKDATERWLSLNHNVDFHQALNPPMP